MAKGMALDAATDRVLADRMQTHGDFGTTAAVAQGIKDLMRWGAGENWPAMAPEAREALDQIAVKMARIVSGDWRHMDHWVDIRGYAAQAQAAAMKATPAASDEGVESL